MSWKGPWRLFLKTFSDGAPMISGGKLFHWLIVLTVGKFLHNSGLLLSLISFQPLFLVLPSGALENNLTPSSSTGILSGVLASSNDVYEWDETGARMSICWPPSSPLCGPAERGLVEFCRMLKGTELTLLLGWGEDSINAGAKAEKAHFLVLLKCNSLTDGIFSKLQHVFSATSGGTNNYNWGMGVNSQNQQGELDPEAHWELMSLAEGLHFASGEVSRYSKGRIHGYEQSSLTQEVLKVAKFGDLCLKQKPISGPSPTAARFEACQPKLGFRNLPNRKCKSLSSGFPPFFSPLTSKEPTNHVHPTPGSQSSLSEPGESERAGLALSRVAEALRRRCLSNRKLPAERRHRRNEEMLRISGVEVAACEKERDRLESSPGSERGRVVAAAATVEPLLVCEEGEGEATTDGFRPEPAGGRV
ncbi:hypothetical protein L345_08310, partial [Ophiophagus hannah]